MRLPLIVALALAWTACAKSSDDVSVQVFEFGGLPLRISDAYQFEIGKLDEFGTVDLKPFFESCGVDLPSGGFIRYNSGSGHLVCRGSAEMMELVDTVLTFLSHHENEIEFATAYLAILKSMKATDRVSTVLKTGYRPDPLIASYIHRIRDIQALLNEAELLSKIPPFPGDEKKKPKLSGAEIASQKKKIEAMKITLADLLSISLVTIESELKVLAKSTVEQAADKNRIQR